MKYLFSLTIPLLLVAVALLPEVDQNDFISYSQQYNTISALVEDCSGENALGAKCEAKCPGQGCACQTNIFKCNCYCVGGDSGPDACRICSKQTTRDFINRYYNINSCPE